MRTLDQILKGEDRTMFLLKCQMSFKFFGDRVLGLNIEPHHEEWVDMVEANKRVLVIAFTGSGKSEIMAIAYPLWKIFKTKGWEALIISKSLKQATSLLERIKSAITDNDILKDLVPKKDTWNKTEINTRNRCKMSCVPYSENVKGYHVDYVLGDEASSYVDKDIYYRYVETRVNTKNGSVCLITTPQHPSDLSQDLLDNPYYATQVLKVLDTDNNPVSKRFPLSKINEIRRRNEMMFRKEYMCDVSVASETPFDMNDIIACFDENRKFTLRHEDYNGTVYSGHDFAVSKVGDYSVSVIVDKIEDDIIIKFIERTRGVSLPEQEDRLVELHSMLHPVTMLVDESNMGQGIKQHLMDKIPIQGQLFSPSKRHELLMNLKRTIETGHLIIPHADDELTSTLIDEMVKELSSFKSTRTPTGQQTLQSRSKHDDCLEENTLIKTKHGWIKIKDVKIGDYVLTHKNRYQKVLNNNKRKIKQNEKLYELKAVGRPKLYITGKHRLYVANKKINTKHKSIIYKGTKLNKNNNYYDKTSWVQVKDLQKNKYGSIYPINNIQSEHIIDLSKYMSESYSCENGYLVSYICSPKTNYKRFKNPKSNKIKRYLKVDTDIGYLLGYYAAEGTIGTHNFSFASHKNEKGIRNFINKLCSTLNLHVTKCYIGNGMQSSFGSIIFRNFFKNNFSTKLNKKYPLFVETLPINIQQNILIGHAIGDGSFTRGALRISTISEVMGYQLFDMFSRCGYIVSIRKQKGQNGHNDPWELSMGVEETNKFLKVIPPELLIGKTVNKKQIKHNQTQIKLYEDYLYSYINRIKEIKPVEYVYNLHVEEDESYIANGYIVHNCVMGLAMAVKAATAEMEFVDYIATEYQEITDLTNVL